MAKCTLGEDIKKMCFVYAMTPSLSVFKVYTKTKRHCKLSGHPLDGRLITGIRTMLMAVQTS